VKILLLTKINLNAAKKSHLSVHDYIKDEYFFDGWNEGFKLQGFKTYLSWKVSYFISSRFSIKYPLFFKILRYFMRKSGLNKLDRFLLSKSIAKYCSKMSINIIFTEINDLISPRIIKQNCINIKIVQWFGVFPDMLSTDTLNVCKEYDKLIGPCQFSESISVHESLSNYHYFGCLVNQRFFYHEYADDCSYDIVFVGGIKKSHSDRIKLLELIAGKYEKFAFFGYGIEQTTKDSLLRKKFKGYADVHKVRKLYSSSKIALNLTLNDYSRVVKGHNIRLFEIASCCGSVQIAQYDTKVLDYFENDSEIVLFKDKSQLLSKLDFILSSHESYRKNIAKKASKRSNNYSFKQQASRVLDVIG
jgi:hypothetical protein